MTDKLLISAILILVLIFGLNWFLYTHPLDKDITQPEADYILAQLQARRTGDCVCVRSGGGFRCESLEDGKVYRVKR